MLCSKMLLVWFMCVCLVLASSETRDETVHPKPNIVLFIADDLGWNDVGFHGSNDIPTPNIDALAYSGLALHNYYVTPICTPSRAALMTGKYPIHTGMQHGVIYGAEPRGLPLSEKILPQYLKELGYKTHLVGKWHLGHYKRAYLPLNRGFDSHTGFWTGRIDMYDHTSMENGSWGSDFRRGFKVAHDLFGEYATDVYTKEAVKVITAHNKTEPLFLMVAHSAVHSGNPNEPIRAPDSEIVKFKHIKNFQRQKFAAVVSKMDESIGIVINSLEAQGFLNNSIILFSTDNGGPAAGFNDNAASNYPLKGVKNTLWEGGVRGAGLLWSPLLEQKSRVATQRMHIVDWLPTLLGAAGANMSSFKNIDGINQWDALSKDLKSERTTLVHNIDDIWETASITMDQWKLIKGASNYNGAWDHWYGPDERNGTYNLDSVYAGKAAKILGKLGLMPNPAKVTEMSSFKWEKPLVPETQFILIREPMDSEINIEMATLKCNQSIGTSPVATLEGPYLYNIEEDPCEYTNLVKQYPEILEKLFAELQRVNATALSPNSKPLDPKGDPKYWGRVYTNFGDYETQHGSAACL